MLKNLTLKMNNLNLIYFLVTFYKFNDLKFKINKIQISLDLI